MRDYLVYMEAEKIDSTENEKVIEFTDIVRFIKDSRNALLIGGGIFFALGVLFALNQKNEYTAVIEVMPEIKIPTAGAGYGDLRSLASLAGVNLGAAGGSVEAVQPALYPDILRSVSFGLYMLKQPVTTVDNHKPQLFRHYLTSGSTGGIFSSIMGIFGTQEEEKPVPTTNVSGALQLTAEEETLCRTISAQITAETDKKTNVMYIKAKMRDPVVAAIVSNQALQYLTNYVRDYRTGKAQQLVTFLAKQVTDARRRYESYERTLATYRDQNRGLYANTAKIEEQRMQADYLLAQDVYGDLAKQLEQARIKVSEEAPVFQVLEPARVPLKKSGPNRSLIVVGFTVLGVFIGMLVFGARRLQASL